MKHYFKHPPKYTIFDNITPTIKEGDIVKLTDVAPSVAMALVLNRDRKHRRF